MGLGYSVFRGFVSQSNVIQVYRGLMSFSVSDDDTQCCCLVSLTMKNYKSYISVALKDMNIKKKVTNRVLLKTDLFNSH